MKSLSTLLIISVLLVFTATHLFAQSESGTQLILSPKRSAISFEWQGAFIHSKWEAHTAIIIPVKLKGCPRTFYMQFDLGAPSSILYKTKLESIRAKYPGSGPLEDTVNTIGSFPFWADRIYIVASEIQVKPLDVAAVNWYNKDEKEIIGTIGADLIDGKVLVIDYPGKKIHILSAVTKRLRQKIAFFPFTYANKSVLLPAKINAKETLLFFDTGSSMFELISNKENCLQLAMADAQPVQYAVKSWNRTLMANTYASSAHINIAGVKLPVQSVTYMEGASNAQVERMLKAGIGGMTGNKLFLNYVLVLDTRNQQFGLISSLKKGDLR